MSIIQATILGVLQGLGEFLPISSSAHLIIFPWLFGWKEHSLAFDVALHLGTLVAVLGYFGKDFFEIIFNGLTKPKSEKGRLLWFIIIATIPGAIFGFLLENTVENVFRVQYLLIAIVLALFGVVLYYADKNSKNNISIDKLNIFHALMIGLSQAFAIFPGISRSGITMTTGLFLGLKKETAAKFSFLMSAPIIFGAGVLQLAKNITEIRHELTPFIIGFLVSCFVGFFAIHFLLNFVKKAGFKVFSYYRFILALIIIVVYFVR